MNAAFVHGVGVAAPGLVDWARARRVLRAEADYAPEPLPTFKTTLLPRNEARRAGAAVKLAFRVAEQAVAGDTAARLSTVFASTGGDIAIADQMCRAVNAPDRPVSPTRFHNSVHNAPAGYWGIATGSRQPATSFSAGPDGFGVALQEAWATLAADGDDVLLVCYETGDDGALHAARPANGGDCALALMLSRNPAGAVARLDRPTPTAAPATRIADSRLDELRRINAAARGLALLAALARGERETIVLAASPVNLSLDVAGVAA